MRQPPKRLGCTPHAAAAARSTAYAPQFTNFEINRARICGKRVQNFKSGALRGGRRRRSARTLEPQTAASRARRHGEDSCKGQPLRDSAQNFQFSHFVPSSKICAAALQSRVGRRGRRTLTALGPDGARACQSSCRMALLPPRRCRRALHRPRAANFGNFHRAARISVKVQGFLKIGGARGVRGDGAARARSLVPHTAAARATQPPHAPPHSVEPPRRAQPPQRSADFK